MFARIFICLLYLGSVGSPVQWGTAAAIRIGTYNLEGYLDEPIPGRPAKSTAARAKIRESIRAVSPDVLALQEIGNLSALQELRASLKADGLDFPYWEYVRGYDTNIHLSILSKFPFAARRPHTSDSFLLGGRRFRVGRGFGEVVIRVNEHYEFTLLTAHLKSRRVVPEADQAELRLREAMLLRDKIDACLRAGPGVNLIVLGDLNDTKDAASTKAVIGKGATRLIDTRPAERSGDSAATSTPGRDPRNVTWTHFYGKDDTYSRIDYILVSPGMAREWIAEDTHVATVQEWGVGSDHRPLVATFEAVDR